MGPPACRPSSVSQPWWPPPQLPPRSSEEGLEVLESPRPGLVVPPPLELPPLPIPSLMGSVGSGLAMVLLEESAMLLPPMLLPPLSLLLSLTLLLMVWESAMALLVTALATELLVMLLLTQLPMPSLRSTPTRSPLTPTNMPWLTTTLDPVLTIPRLTTAPQSGRATTLSTCLMAASSTSTTGPTMPKATSLRSPTMARPSSLTLLLPLLPTPLLVQLPLPVQLLPMLLPVQLLPMLLLVQLLPLLLALLAPSATWAKYHKQ